MTQETIGQRIKFLMDELHLKVRTFASALDVSETNIRNYVTRDSKPSSDILERILLKYPSVNSHWLLTGKGEPFTSDSDQVRESSSVYQKNISGGNNVGVNHGTNTMLTAPGAAGNTRTLDACQVKLNQALADVSNLQAQLQRADAQLAEKERLIQILLNQQPK